MSKQSNLGVDLHTHTQASDGLWSPKGLIEAALERNVRVLSVCDHETTANLKAVQTLAYKHGIHFIPGVEMAIEHRNSTYHLLLYGFNPENANLQAMLYETRLKLWHKKQIMAAALKKEGYALPERKNITEVGSTSPLYELAGELVSENENITFKQAWEICRKVEPAIKVGQPAAKALSVARAAGAITVLAHPARGGLEITIASNETLKELVKMGLEGLEAYYPAHTLADTQRLVNFANEHKLLVSCGSDSHSAQKKADCLECESMRWLTKALIRKKVGFNSLTN